MQSWCVIAERWVIRTRNAAGPGMRRGPCSGDGGGEGELSRYRRPSPHKSSRRDGDGACAVGSQGVGALPAARLLY